MKVAEQDLKIIFKSDALTFLKMKFPTLKWTHFVQPTNPLPDTGFLVGTGDFFRIKVDLLPVGVLAELTVGLSPYGLVVLARSKNLVGVSLEQAIAPIEKAWLCMGMELGTGMGDRTEEYF